MISRSWELYSQSCGVSGHLDGSESVDMMAENLDLVALDEWSGSSHLEFGNGS
jgi:hypothetical protein